MPLRVFCWGSWFYSLSSPSLRCRGTADVARGKRSKRIRLTVVLLSSAAITMMGLAWASVPLYKLFCQVTGYAGTTQIAVHEADEILDRVVKVRFNADVAGDLPWTFQPVQRELSLRVGETRMAYYQAINHSSDPVVGTATFNVTPAKFGPYFSKIDCFCFTEQELAPGETAELPVTFFIDPAIVDDHNLDGVKTVTLSYMFFRKKRELSGLQTENRVASLDPPQRLSLARR